MTFSIQEYIDMAIKSSEQGYFTSKASQKDALQHLNLAYNKLTKDIKHPLGSTPQDKWKLSIQVPNDLHLVKEKHRSVFDVCHFDTSRIFEVKKIRDEIKELEVIKPCKDDTYRMMTQEILETVETSRHDQTKTLVKDYFKGLNVRYTWHFVTNSHGTRFIRVFWFLNGKLTKLSELLLLKRGAE